MPTSCLKWKQLCNKPADCQICGKKVTMLRNMKNHLKFCHQDFLKMRESVEGVSSDIALNLTYANHKKNANHKKKKKFASHTDTISIPNGIPESLLKTFKESQITSLSIQKKNHGESDDGTLISTEEAGMSSSPRTADDLHKTAKTPTTSTSSRKSHRKSHASCCCCHSAKIPTNSTSSISCLQSHKKEYSSHVKLIKLMTSTSNHTAVLESETVKSLIDNFFCKYENGIGKWFCFICYKHSIKKTMNHRQDWHIKGSNFKNSSKLWDGMKKHVKSKEHRLIEQTTQFDLFANDKTSSLQQCAQDSEDQGQPGTRIEDRGQTEITKDQDGGAKTGDILEVECFKEELEDELLINDVLIDGIIVDGMLMDGTVIDGMAINSPPTESCLAAELDRPDVVKLRTFRPYQTYFAATPSKRSSHNVHEDTTVSHICHPSSDEQDLLSLSNTSTSSLSYEENSPFKSNTIISNLSHDHQYSSLSKISNDNLSKNKNSLSISNTSAGNLSTGNQPNSILPAINLSKSSDKRPREESEKEEKESKKKDDIDEPFLNYIKLSMKGLSVKQRHRASVRILEVLLECKAADD